MNAATRKVLFSCFFVVIIMAVIPWIRLEALRQDGRERVALTSAPPSSRYDYRYRLPVPTTLGNVHGHRRSRCHHEASDNQSMQGNDMINLDRTTATRRARIDSLRKTALVAGDLPDHLVSIPTLSLYGPVRNNPNYVLGPGPGHSHAGGWERRRGSIIPYGPSRLTDRGAITKCCWIAAFGGKLTSLA